MSVDGGSREGQGKEGQPRTEDESGGQWETPGRQERGALRTAKAGEHPQSARQPYLLVKVIEEADGLNDHRVDLVRGELELVAGQGVRKTQSHGCQIMPCQPRDQPSHLRKSSWAQ